MQHLLGCIVHRFVELECDLLETGDLARPLVGRHPPGEPVVVVEIAPDVPELLEVGLCVAFGLFDAERGVASLTTVLGLLVLAFDLFVEREELAEFRVALVDRFTRDAVALDRDEAQVAKRVSESLDERLALSVVSRSVAAQIDDGDSLFSGHRAPRWWR